MSKNENDKYNLAASFQKKIEQILYKKTKIAFDEYEKHSNLKKKVLVVAGGVAANLSIRKNLKEISLAKNFQPLFPKIEYCGDNAAMIAWNCLNKNIKSSSDLYFKANPRLSIK